MKVSSETTRGPLVINKNCTRNFLHYVCIFVCIVDSISTGDSKTSPGMTPLSWSVNVNDNYFVVKVLSPFTTIDGSQYPQAQKFMQENQLMPFEYTKEARLITGSGDRSWLVLSVSKMHIDYPAYAYPTLLLLSDRMVLDLVCETGKRVCILNDRP